MGVTLTGRRLRRSGPSTMVGCSATRRNFTASLLTKRHASSSASTFPSAYGSELRSESWFQSASVYTLPSRSERSPTTARYDDVSTTVRTEGARWHARSTFSVPRTAGSMSCEIGSDAFARTGDAVWITTSQPATAASNEPGSRRSASKKWRCVGPEEWSERSVLRTRSEYFDERSVACTT